MNRTSVMGEHSKVHQLVKMPKGGQVEGVFQVRRKDMQAFREKPGRYLSLVLGDSTGEVEAKVWDNAEELAAAFERGDCLYVAGTVTEFGGRVQLNVDKLVRIPPEQVDPRSFLPVTGQNIAKMGKELRQLISGVQHPQLRALLESFLADPEWRKSFASAPAAKAHHQAYLGGLLEHTLQVVKVAHAMASVYPQVDVDLLTCGAILHDVGKVREFLYQTVIDYSDEGRLLGHIVVGVEMVNDRIRSIADFDPDLRLKILHMIVSHHGRYEWQSPKRPKFLEAMLLHYADMVDAEVDKFSQAQQSAEEEGERWTPWVKGLDRQLFVG